MAIDFVTRLLSICPVLAFGLGFFMLASDFLLHPTLLLSLNYLVTLHETLSMQPLDTAVCPTAK